MGEPAGFVCKQIMYSPQEVVPRHIAVVTLVQSLDAEEVCRRRHGCDGSFALPEDGGSVVGVAGKCAFSHIKGVCYCIMVDHTTS